MRLRSLLSVSLCALLSLAPLTAQDLGVANPDLFVKSLEATRQAIEFYGSYDNPQELLRVSEIGYRIAQETRFSKYPFSFFLVDIPVPNAFALPGGQIFITRGMLDLGLTDDMLGGLMGHEIGHVVKNHGTRMQRRATLLNVLSQTLLAGVIIASDNSRDDYVPPTGGYDPTDPRGDRIMGAAAAGLVVSELLLRSYSREFEDEADDEGQRYAAGAGFDPKGYRLLMDLMRTRLPESKAFGYWRTHPFFESRVRAADVRADLLTIQEEQPVDEFRQQTQATLLGLTDLAGLEEPAQRLLEDASLTAWPIGPAADEIRLDRLHETRDLELEKNLLARDYGRLLEEYERTRGQVAELDPEGGILATLDDEMSELRNEVKKISEQALEVLAGGIYETEFLETFLSNYPDSVQVTDVALELGDAYARLQRPEAAAKMYLRAWKRDPGSEAGRRAQSGLRILTPMIEDLSVLERLTAEVADPELQRIAEEQLDKSVASFSNLSNGATFLKEFPTHGHSKAVTARINKLAEDLLGEATLYQRVGDNAKALDRINLILTEAPFSPAAEKLRQDAVLQS
jgi:predicted Zn-dependent protease